MSVREIAFVMYPVRDMQASLAFYRDVIGLAPSGLASDAWTEFDIAGATFGIGAFPQVGTPGNAGALALEIDDLPAMRERLLALGTEVSEPYETPICWISQLRDPDGNTITLHQRKPS